LVVIFTGSNQIGLGCHLVPGQSPATRSGLVVIFTGSNQIGLGCHLVPGQSPAISKKTPAAKKLSLYYHYRNLTRAPPFVV
jgi:hypothetical protein